MFDQIGANAQRAARKLASLDTAAKNEALRAMADELDRSVETVLAANDLDMEDARAQGIGEALLDRLDLSRVGGRSRTEFTCSGPGCRSAWLPSSTKRDRT